MPLRDYKLFTLVDITKTGARTPDSDPTQRDQQRNYQTVEQTLSLRTQPIINSIDSFPNVAFDNKNLKHRFGDTYTGEHTVWAIHFSVEFDDIFRVDNNPTALLEDDFNEVPVVVGLNETARFLLPCFFTSGTLKNIFFIEENF